VNYEIRVEGVLDPGWSSWFDGSQITDEPGGDSVIAGAVVDQAALYGLLVKIRDIGLTLISIRCDREAIVQAGRNVQSIADRVEIEALRGEFTDAGMMRDYDRFASLFTQDAVWRIPGVDVEFVGRDEIRAGIERLQEGLWEYLVQTTHPGTVRVEGDTASGRAYVLTLGRTRDGGSHLNYSMYHDRYRRTPDGWKFTERVDEIRYLDTTPLTGSPPTAAA
jgi:uncharacterized protein (TIGR02246 family)